jgi:hypothetical protein
MVFRRKARLEEMLDGVSPTQRRWNTDESGNDRTDRERHQRDRHRFGRLVWSVPRSMTMPYVSIRRPRPVRLCRAVGHFVVVFVRAPVSMSV